LDKVLEKDDIGTEQVLEIVYQQQAVFRVRAVTRCTRYDKQNKKPDTQNIVCFETRQIFLVDFEIFWYLLLFISLKIKIEGFQFHFIALIYFSSNFSSMPGHAEAVISVSFSPDGLHLASGSGDTTVRFWDVSTQTPHFVGEGHKNWVLCISWAPNSKKLASACKNGTVFLWDPNTGKPIGKPLLGHKQWITSLAWEPLHL